MRIAILILAHKNPCQLQLLVERLQSDFDVYIHLDKGCDIEETIFDMYSNVYCIKKYRTRWGSYNGILAPLELFRIAHKKDYDYYIHISGQDLPIKPNRNIVDFLEKNKTVSFIDHHELPWDVWGEDGGLGRIQYYWSHNLGNSVIDSIKKMFIGIINKMQFSFNIKRKLSDMTFYGGSNWVNLNKEAVTYLVNYINDNPDYLSIFKYSVNADELWMQTILCNNASLSLTNDSLRYVDWSESNGKASPRELTIQDETDIMCHSGLFARKFDETVDKEIINNVLSTTK